MKIFSGCPEYMCRHLRFSRVRKEARRKGVVIEKGGPTFILP